jgi:hypothetical protein
MDKEVLDFLSHKIAKLQNALSVKIIEYASSIEPKTDEDGFEALTQKKIAIFRNLGQFLTLLEEIPALITLMRGDSKESNLEFLKELDFENLMYGLTPRLMPIFISTASVDDYENSKQEILQRIDTFFKNASEEMQSRKEKGILNISKHTETPQGFTGTVH